MVIVLQAVRSVYRAVTHEYGQSDRDFSPQRRALTVF